MTKDWIDLLTVEVAGLRHHAYKDRAAVAALALGEVLTLVRETYNPHDGNAVRIDDCNGQTLGYVPATQVRPFAALCDAGYPLRATVDFADERKLAVAVTLQVQRHPTAAPIVVERDVLAEFEERVQAIELPGEAVGLWLAYRGAIAPLPAEKGKAAWELLCKRTEAVGGMKNAKVWLKRAIDVEAARRGSPASDQQA